jgi:transposase InsO family protein
MTDNSSSTKAAKKASAADAGNKAGGLDDGVAEVRGFGPVPAFTGEGWRGWKKTIMSVLDLQGLLQVVLKGVPNGGFLRSEIGAEAEAPADDEGDVTSVNGGGEEAKADPGLVMKSKRAFTMLLMALRTCGEAMALIDDVPSGNARELWRRLEAHYERKTEAGKFALMKELSTLRQSRGERMQAYVTRTKHVVLQLQEVGETVSSTQIKHAFIDGITSDRTLKALLHLQGSGLSFTEICDKAINWETQNGQPTSSSSMAMANAASVARGARSGERSDKAKRGPVCFKCGQAGHIRSECRQKAKLCSHCNKSGHIENECWEKCPEKKPAEMRFKKQESGHFAEVEQAFAGAAEVKKNGVQRWILDSGASRHMVTSAVPLTNAEKSEEVQIRTASGAILKSPLKGEAVLEAAGQVVALSNVLGHNELQSNLLSVSAMMTAGSAEQVVFTRDGAEVFGADGSVLLVARNEGGVYVVDNKPGSKGGKKKTHLEALAGIAATPVDAALIHSRAAHAAPSSIAKLQKAGAVAGLESVQFEQFKRQLCEPCVKGKAHRAAFGKIACERTQAQHALARVCADLAGPFQAESLRGEVYLLVLVDEWSRQAFVYPLRSKSNAGAKIMDWCRAAKAKQGRGVVNFHSDGGGEFISAELNAFFRQEGITATTTTPHTPQHNGIAERMIRTVVEKGRTIMQAARAPKVLWGPAMEAAVYVRNRTTLRKGTQETPEGLWHKADQKPSVRGLRVWGCDAWMHVASSEREKLDAKAKPCIFIGYDVLGYKLLDVETMKVVRTRDVTFDESKFAQMQRFREALLLSPDDNGEYKEFDEWLNLSRFEAETRLVQQISLEEAEQRRVATPIASGVGVAASPVQSEPEAAPELAEQEAQIAAPDAWGAAPAASKSDLERGVGASEEQLLMQRHLEASARQEAELHHSEQPEEQAEAPFAGDDESNFEEGGADPESPAPVAVPAVRVSARSNKGRPPPRYGGSSEDVAYAAQEQAEGGALPEPRNLKEALMGRERAEWLAACKRELRSLREHGTWELTQLPRGRKAIGTKWVFRRKLEADGTTRYKARLVAQGFSQREGVDYNETFAPVLHYKTLRVFLALVAVLDLELKHLDVETAFLNAKVKEEIYVRQPEGFEEVDFDLVCKLIKSLYGIKQAPHEWHEDFDQSIISLGYRRCQSDTCVYVKISKNGKPIIHCLFVDDLFSACDKEDLEEMEADRSALSRKYKVKDLGDAKLVLGMGVTRNRATKELWLDQEQYLLKLLQRHGMEECRSAASPMEVGHRLRKEEEDGMKKSSERHEYGTREEYRSVVGGLLYAALSTRPDIAYQASVLSRFLTDPHPHHWAAAKRVLRYLRGTAALGLKFGGEAAGADGQSGGGVELGPVYCDADWAGDEETRRSTTGFVVMLGGGAVSWQSKRQQTVALSSAEAEYMAAAAATQETVWVRTLLAELGYAQRTPTTLLCDNQAAIAMVSNAVHHSRTKHIDLRHHFIREQATAGSVRVQWVSTTDQAADLLTKPLGRQPFTVLCDRLMSAVGNRK